MNILLTGASSFTGYWFASQLASIGHSVTATLTSERSTYSGVRASRIDKLSERVDLVAECPFGSSRFMDLVHSRTDWDVLCHHGADVREYKSQDFDVLRAVNANVFNLPSVLKALEERNASRVVITGSVFEQGEGAGSDGLPSFSPYGHSKYLSAEYFRYCVGTHGLQFGKFVIPNPFGPLEDPRFTAYLARCWRAGEVARVNTPEYVRDNIHVSLLARCYSNFVGAPLTASDRLNPSGYIESQGTFAFRVAREFHARLGWECAIELGTQIEFPEPRIRINTDPALSTVHGWDEQLAWIELADYYAQG